MEKQLISFIKDIPETNPTDVQLLIKTKFSQILFKQYQLSNLDLTESIRLLIPAVKDICIIVLIFEDKKIYLEKKYLCNKIEFFKILIEDMGVHDFMTEIKVPNIKYPIMMIILDYLTHRKIKCTKENFTDLFFTVHYLLNVDHMMKYLIVNFNKVYPSLFKCLLKDHHYQLIYNYCDILSKHNQSNEYILTILKNTLINLHPDFFTSSLYHYIVSIDKVMADEFVIKYQYYPLFQSILTSDNVDQLISLLLKANQYEILKSLHISNDKVMVENAIISSWDLMSKELFTYDSISDDLLFALILKFDDFDRLTNLKIKHPVVICHLHLYVKQLLLKNNIVMLNLLHNKLDKVFENVLQNELSASIFEMNIEKFSDDLIWALILKYNKYDYLSLLSPTNKYVMPTTYTFTVFVDFISTLLKNKPANMFSIIENLYYLFGIIIENVLISLIKELPKEIVNHVTPYSNELILLLMIEFDILLLSRLKQPLTQLTLFSQSSSYLFSNQFTKGNLSTFINNHMDEITTIYPIFYALLGSSFEDEMMKHKSERLMKCKIVSPRFQSILNLSFGSIEEVKKVKLDKNDPLIRISVISILNMTNKNVRHEENLNLIKNSNCVFLEYSNKLIVTGLMWIQPMTIIQILNFVPDIKTCHYMATLRSDGTVLMGKVDITVNQSILIQNSKKLYEIDKIKKLLINTSTGLHEVDHYQGYHVIVILENNVNQEIVMYV